MGMNSCIHIYTYHISTEMPMVFFKLRLPAIQSVWISIALISFLAIYTVCHHGR